MSTTSESSHKFQTETQKVLKIIINSLYQNKEVFLREIISNASDALNKVRLKLLTSEKVYEREFDLKIELIPDKENNTLTIRDSGIGLTKQEMIHNLGTIAQSGTQEFLDALESGENGDSLIGKFGVGFYSAFLVADEVVVESRSYKPNAKGAKWKSGGESEFTVTANERVNRGTDIILKLKDDFKKYTEDYELKNLISKYSNYVEFPIMLGEDQLNDETAIWRISPKEVEEEQYEQFYQNLGQFGKPMMKIHVKTDIPIEFYSILYVPPTKPRQMANDKDWGLRLYNRKILVEDNNKDFLPEYLRFMNGVVDAEDLDLNVSREVLQNTRVQSSIKKYLHKKVLDELEKQAKDDEDAYMDFFREFGPFMKEGIASEVTDKHKNRITNLLRFYTTGEGGNDGSVTLAKYLERMKVGQDTIYYLTGLDMDMVKKSPHLEYYKKEGFEVLLLGEPIDSFMMMHLTEYHEKKFYLIDQDESEDDESDNTKADDSAEEGEEKKEKTGPLAPILNLFVEVLGPKVTDVKTSDRIVDSVARLVTPKGGISSDLQRAMKIMESGQGSPAMNLPMMGKILQLNPDHELIISMNNMVENDENKELLTSLIEQIHDNSRIIDGDVPDFLAMTKRIEKIMSKTLSE
ncbi:MAG: molecular chaperone HtpG [Candidatus Heimdallarchaeota archaeon]|nr:molecular chaperone HtpG [Candidatus Heimdallarchaeota archaeon]